MNKGGRLGPRIALFVYRFWYFVYIYRTWKGLALKRPNPYIYIYISIGYNIYSLVYMME